MCQIVWLFHWSKALYPDVKASRIEPLRDFVLIELHSDESANPSDDRIAGKLIKWDVVVVFGSCEAIVKISYEASSPWITGREEKTPEIVKRFDRIITDSRR